MDDFTYQYESGKNRLLGVEDAVVGETVTYDHITYNSSPLNHNGKVYRTITVEDDVTVSPGQSPFLQANESISLKQSFHAKAGSGFHAKWTDAPNEEEGQGDNSTFAYDAIGNLISDSGEGTSIEWTPYGKVRTVTKTDGTVVNYRYDAAGNRVEKQVVSSDTSYVTRYIRDASGNVLAIYQNDSLTEQPIYGSSRLGVYKGGSEAGEGQYGNRRFELANHLGNVQVIVSDKILMEDSDGDGVAESRADILATYDYYPGGMMMPGRVYDNGYRYGFGSHERDDEIKGTGGHYAFSGYGYDPKLVRRWRPDPAFKEYPSFSPYAAFGNNPLIFTDPDGKRLYFVGGAGNDQDGWNYKQRFKAIWEGRGIRDVRTISATHGKMGDVLFTDTYKNFSQVGNTTTKVTSEMIQATVSRIAEDLAANPLADGEQLNLAGYSYGSVLQAHVAIALADQGIKVDNLSLVGSPISDDSDLMKTLNQYKKEGKIGDVQRVDIEGDKLSNPSGELEYIQGGIDASPLGEGDNAPHFDLARPGTEADKKIGEAADQLISEGVQ